MMALWFVIIAPYSLLVFRKARQKDTPITETKREKKLMQTVLTTIDSIGFRLFEGTNSKQTSHSFGDDKGKKKKSNLYQNNGTHIKQ